MWGRTSFKNSDLYKINVASQEEWLQLDRREEDGPAKKDHIDGSAV